VETLLATDELMTAARRTRRFDRLMEALLRRASCFIESGDGFRFRTTQAEHRRIAHQLRYPIELWHSSLLEATTLLLEGDFARAESVARDSGARAAPQLGVSARAFLGAQLISFALEQHPKTAWARFQEALVVGRELLGLAPTYQGWIVGTAMIELELGNPRAAMNLLKHLRECGLGAILTDVNRFLCLVHLARIAWRLGDLDFASNLVQVLEPLAGSHAGNWGIYFGPISYYSGKLHLSLEQKARAIDCFEHAAIDSDRIGSRPWRAWSEHGLAEALALDPRKQDVERQNVLLESVRTQANALNMGRLLYELDRPGGVAARFK
jgi:tetratricopeptide (TPR) repeat protein